MRPITDKIKKLETALNINTKPDRSKFPRYRESAVIDENKSVKWNREEIIKRNEAFQKEVSRLQTIRSKEINKVISEICLDIVSQLDNRITLEQAKLIYDTAWAKGYSQGVNCVFNEIDEYIEFVSKFMDKAKS